MHRDIRRRAWSPTRLALECLENRDVPASLYWDGLTGGLWDDPQNWSTNTLPTADDDVEIDLASTETVILPDGFGASVRSLTSTAHLVVGGVLELGTFSILHGRLDVTGTLLVSTLHGSGGLLLSAGGTFGGVVTVTNDASVHLAGGEFELVDGGTMVGNGAYHLASTLEASDGQVSAEFVVEAGGSLSVTGMSVGFTSPTFTNHGLVTIATNAILTLGTTFLNAIDGRFFVNASADVKDVGQKGKVVNEGTGEIGGKIEGGVEYENAGKGKLYVSGTPVIDRLTQTSADAKVYVHSDPANGASVPGTLTVRDVNLTNGTVIGQVAGNVQSALRTPDDMKASKWTIDNKIRFESISIQISANSEITVGDVRPVGGFYDTRVDNYGKWLLNDTISGFNFIFHNYGTFEFSSVNTTRYSSELGAGANIFHNVGKLIKPLSQDGSDLETVFRAQLFNDIGGDVVIESGTMTLRGNSSFAGRVTVQQYQNDIGITVPAVLALEGPDLAGKPATFKIIQNGLAEFKGPGTIELNGNMLLSIEQPVIFSGSLILNNDLATIAGVANKDSILSASRFVWTAGKVVDGTYLLVRPTDTLILDTSTADVLPNLIDSSVNIQGLGVWRSGDIQFKNSFLTVETLPEFSQALFVVTSNAGNISRLNGADPSTITIQNGGRWSSPAADKGAKNAGNIGPEFINGPGGELYDGWLNFRKFTPKNQSSSLFNGQSRFGSTVTTEGGVIKILDVALMTIDGNLDLPAGVFAGSGIVSTALFANGGTVLPGDVAVAGQITIVGGYTQTGALAIELGGGANPVAGTDYDQLQLTPNGATVQLGGTLDLTALSGFAPSAGASYTIVENTGTGSTKGFFTNLPEGAVTFVGGTPFQITYKGGDGNDVTLTRVNADVEFAGGYILTGIYPGVIGVAVTVYSYVPGYGDDYYWTYTLTNYEFGPNDPQVYINSDAQTSFWAIADGPVDATIQASDWAGHTWDYLGSTGLFWSTYPWYLPHYESVSLSFTTDPVPIVLGVATFGSDNYGEVTGFIPVPSDGTLGTASISGRLWADLDWDGVREAGEGSPDDYYGATLAGYSGYYLQLVNADTGQVVQTLTDVGSDGSYAFTGLVAGNYKVVISDVNIYWGENTGGSEWLAARYGPTDVGGDDSVDSDFFQSPGAPLPEWGGITPVSSTGTTGRISLFDGDTVDDVDAGLWWLDLYGVAVDEPGVFQDGLV